MTQRSASPTSCATLSVSAFASSTFTSSESTLTSSTVEVGAAVPGIATASCSPAKQRHRISQRFQNNPYIGTFGSYSKHGIGFPASPSSSSILGLKDSTKIRQQSPILKSELENPYVGFLRHAPSYSLKAKRQLTNDKKKTEEGVSQGLFDILQETLPAHAAVTRIGVISDIWKKRHLSPVMLQELPLVRAGPGGSPSTGAGATGILGILMANRTIKGQCCCAICKNDFVEDDSLRLLPCGHVFHRTCADKWLLGTTGHPFIQTNTCPLCKINVTDELTKLERTNHGISRKTFANLGRLVWKRCKGRRRTPEELKKLHEASVDGSTSTVVATSPCTFGHQRKNARHGIETGLLNVMALLLRRRQASVEPFCDFYSPYDNIRLPEVFSV